MKDSDTSETRITPGLENPNVSDTSETLGLLGVKKAGHVRDQNHTQSLETQKDSGMPEIF